MEYAAVEALRERHPAWRLLRAGNAALLLWFLGRHFVERNSGSTPGSVLAAALDDELHALNVDPDEPRYPRRAGEYLDDWSSDDAGWLRRFYPVGSDEIHYDATPAFEKAYGWVQSLQARSFVGTESRLQTVVDLLRQIVHGAETDPDVRLAELRRRRDALDAQIAAAEAGQIDVLDPTALRERYQQAASTARELLADFREVEENFRALDRSAREQIASWTGSKGELLAELVGSRSSISGSDQGRSFQAFYDFLLSQARQDELTDLLTHVLAVPTLEVDQRIAVIHHDWSDAAERTQGTVRQLSEQFRRFLDDQVWLENRRVLDLVKSIEASALALRDQPPDAGLEIDEQGIGAVLPFERPLYDASPATQVDSLIDPAADDDVDVAALFSQTYVDHARLAANIRAVVPPRSTALLRDIIDFYPLDQGAAEIVGYLSLEDEGILVAMDESDEMVIDFVDTGRQRRLRLPKVTVTRR
jgi:flagellar motility protein MotE (MotC chaperone)